MIPASFLLSLSFFFGAAVGSFLNVVIFRLGKESLRGRSRCMSCGKILRWYELLPLVSFIIQAGRCRSCKARLSWQYPIVEGLSGLLFAAILWRFIYAFPWGGPASSEIFFHLAGWWVWPIIIFWWLSAGILIAIAVYDLKYYLIPDVLVFFGLLVSLVYVLFQEALGRFKIGGELFPAGGIVFGGESAMLLGRAGGVLLAGILGAGVAAGALGLIWFFSRGRAMGFGDVKLAAFLGILLGWPDILSALFFAFLSGTLVSLPLLILKRKGLKDILPFGPFLVLGAFLTMMAGDRILDLYFSIFPNIFL